MTKPTKSFVRPWLRSAWEYTQSYWSLRCPFFTNHDSFATRWVHSNTFIIVLWHACQSFCCFCHCVVEIKTSHVKQRSKSKWIWSGNTTITHQRPSHEEQATALFWFSQIQGFITYFFIVTTYMTVKKLKQYYICTYKCNSSIIVVKKRECCK